MTTARDIRNRLKAEHEQRRAEATRLRRERLARLPVGLVWRIGRVAPGKDFAVERGLVEAGLFAFAPRMTVTIGDRARRRDVDRALFPGYVFFAPDVDHGPVMPMARRGERAWLFGVEGLTGALADADGAWRALPEAVVRRLMEAEQAGLFDTTDSRASARRRTLAARLRKGDSVTILDGPLKGWVGRVLCAKPGDRLKVLVNMLGGEARADVGLDSVALMDSP